MMRSVEATLRDRLASVVNAMGYEFIGCELKRQGGQSIILRVYIDNEQGITLDDCSKVSYQISAVLDVEDPLPGRYTLEISSPGINRPLFEMAHYQKWLGYQVKIRVHHPINGRRQFKGVLQRVEGVNIYLLVDTGEVVLPFSDIEQANLIEMSAK